MSIHPALATGCVLMLVATLAAQAATPAIDCHRAATAVDRAICESPEDVALDREITALYDRGLAAFLSQDRHRLAQGQLAYLRKRRGCDWASHHSAHPGTAISECTRAVMDGRVRSLRSVVDRGSF